MHIQLKQTRPLKKDKIKGLVTFAPSDICVNDISAKGQVTVRGSFWLTELRGKDTKLGEGGKVLSWVSPAQRLG